MIKFEEWMLTVELDYEWARENMSESDFRLYFYGERAVQPNIKGQPITHFEKGKWYKADVSKISSWDAHCMKSEYGNHADFMAAYDGSPHLCVASSCSIYNRFLAKFDTSDTTDGTLYSYARCIDCWEEL